MSNYNKTLEEMEHEAYLEASVASEYYNTLVKEGVPTELANGLTLNRQLYLHQRLSAIEMNQIWTDEENGDIGDIGEEYV